MEFINHFNERGGAKGVPFEGTAVFGDGKLVIRLPNSKKTVERGYIEGGFGVVTEDCSPRKSPYTMITVALDAKYLPPNLQAKNYKFKIKARLNSENEFIFLYSDAKMMTHK